VEVTTQQQDAKATKHASCSTWLKTCGSMHGRECRIIKTSQRTKL